MGVSIERWLVCNFDRWKNIVVCCGAKGQSVVGTAYSFCIAGHLMGSLAVFYGIGEEHIPYKTSDMGHWHKSPVDYIESRRLLYEYILYNVSSPSY